MSTPEVKDEVTPQQQQDQDQSQSQIHQESSEQQPTEEPRDVEMNDAEETTATPQLPAETIIDYAEESRKIEEKAKAYLARQTKPVIVPSFAGWFDFEKIHEIEKNHYQNSSIVIQDLKLKNLIKILEIS